MVRPIAIRVGGGVLHTEFAANEAARKAVEEAAEARYLAGARAAHEEAQAGRTLRVEAPAPEPEPVRHGLRGHAFTADSRGLVSYVVFAAVLLCYILGLRNADGYVTAPAAAAATPTTTDNNS